MASSVAGRRSGEWLGVENGEVDGEEVEEEWTAPISDSSKWPRVRLMEGGQNNPQQIGDESSPTSSSADFEMPFLAFVALASINCLAEESVVPEVEELLLLREPLVADFIVAECCWS